MASPTSMLLLMLHLQSIEQQQEILLEPFYSDQTAVVFCYGFHNTVKRKAKSQRQRMRAHSNINEKIRTGTCGGESTTFSIKN